jgi:anti-sigma regulatory factor (Ser/Thr protein kinase)
LIVVAIDLTLPARPEMLSEARTALDRLQDTAPKELLDNVRLMVSELLSNSMKHAKLDAGDTIELHVSAESDQVRVEVVDAGPGFSPKESAPSMYQDSGWGLFLVEQLSDRWGVEQIGHATTVWFEIDWSS